jgi:hypothetical protein
VLEIKLPKFKSRTRKTDLAGHRNTKRLAELKEMKDGDGAGEKK